VRPGRIWYVIALAVLAAGIAWLAYGVVSLVGTIDGLQRVSLPGGGTISLTHSGGYTVYYEGPGSQRRKRSVQRAYVSLAAEGRVNRATTRATVPQADLTASSTRARKPACSAAVVNRIRWNFPIPGADGW
jgi:hypothetical protein